MENKKNYYELLEIDKNASQEVMDKAYKTLIKKYHPDLQNNENKEKYEKIVKEINEAYETLSDEEKKKEYNKALTKDTVSVDKYNELYEVCKSLQHKLDYIQAQTQTQIPKTDTSQINNTQNENIDIQNNLAQEYHQQYVEKLNAAINKAYHDAYIQDLKNRGYKIKYKKSFKEKIKNIITLTIFLLIIILIFNIPFIKNQIVDILTQNKFISYILTTIK